MALEFKSKTESVTATNIHGNLSVNYRFTVSDGVISGNVSAEAVDETSPQTNSLDGMTAHSQLRMSTYNGKEFSINTNLDGDVGDSIDQIKLDLIEIITNTSNYTS